MTADKSPSCSSKLKEGTDTRTRRRGWWRDRMRLHVHFIQRGPGEWYYCSRVLAWTIGIALLDWPGQVMGWWLPWHGQRSCRGQRKRMVHRRRNLCTPDGWILWYFALHDWEPIGFGPCFYFSYVAFSQDPNGNVVCSAFFLHSDPFEKPFS